MLSLLISLSGKMEGSSNWFDASSCWVIHATSIIIIIRDIKKFWHYPSSLLKSFIHSIFLGQVSVFWGLTSWKYGRIMGWEEKIPLFLVSKNFFTFFRLNPERFGGDFKEEVQVSLTCWFYFIQSFLFSISYVRYVDSQLKSTSHKYF